VDRAVDGLQELPEDRGGDVAEDRTVAAGENRGHEAGTMARCAVSHHVDAVVNSVKKAALHPPRDPVLPNPNGVELRSRHHPVLLGRKFGYSQIECVALLPHVGE
jgi:hypothetical protein